MKRFQARHGLAPDGVIGPATAKALAVPAEARVRQIELALERLRWIPALERGRVVFVNIPAFELWAFDEIEPAGASSVQMAVVVGRALRTQTPAFTGVMKTVVFAPYWNVPRSIARNEIVPKLRKNPGYLASQNMEIVSGGAVLGTSPDAIAQLEQGSARLRQKPGPKNALGRVKFLFPNSNNVYLHDTPTQSVFQHARRDFSHGCVRLAAPAALAHWVLRARGLGRDAGRERTRLEGGDARVAPETHPRRAPLHDGRGAPGRHDLLLRGHLPPRRRARTRARGGISLPALNPRNARDVHHAAVLDAIDDRGRHGGIERGAAEAAPDAPAALRAERRAHVVGGMHHDASLLGAIVHARLEPHEFERMPVLTRVGSRR